MFENVQDLITSINKLTSDEFKGYVQTVGIPAALNFLEVDETQLYKWCYGEEPIPMPYKCALTMLIGVITIGSNDEVEEAFVDSIINVTEQLYND